MSHLAAWFVALWLLGWVLLPLSRQVFAGLPDGGLAAGRVLGLVAPALLAFWGASLHLIPLTAAPGWFIGVALCGAAPLLRPSSRRDFWAWLRARRRALLASDLVFGAAFAFFVWVRLRHPEINDLEKPMDAALLGSLQRASFLPPENPWFSGTPFNGYYYFGHLMAALPARLFATPPPIAYNLAQPVWCALWISSLWSLCAALTAARPADSLRPVGLLRRGVAATVIVALLGHFEPLRQWWLPSPVANAKFLGLDWWSTSRVIPNTINEYPAFTLLIGDLHAHFLALPLSTVSLCLCHALFVRDVPEYGNAPSGLTPHARRHIISITLGLLLGAMAMTNTWDVPICALLAVLCTLWTRPDGFSNRRALAWGLGWAVLPLLLSRLVSWPFYRAFQAPIEGVRLELWSLPAPGFFLLWGGFVAAWALFVAAVVRAAPPERSRLCFGARRTKLFAALCLSGVLAGASLLRATALAAVVLLLCFTVAALWTTARRARPGGSEERDAGARSDAGGQQPDDCRFLLLLGLAGIAALLTPMLFYVRGVFGDGALRHQDTVFKFGLQAWLLLGTAAACGGVRLWSAWQWKGKAAAAIGAAAIPLLCAVCVLWTRTVRDATRDANGRVLLSLDGARHLPAADRAAIAWLSVNAKAGEAVLEAVGRDSYSEFARVSALSGVATPLGWQQHVRGWGAEEAEIVRRRRAAQGVFAWPDDASARSSLQVLQSLGVRYVFVGDMERRTYSAAALSRLRAALPIAFRSGSTFIARVPPSAAVGRRQAAGGSNDNAAACRRSIVGAHGNAPSSRISQQGALPYAPTDCVKVAPAAEASHTPPLLLFL